ncbi:MAG: hypothetical protein ACKO5Q_08560 [Microcystaceae cyanobacterium]
MSQFTQPELQTFAEGWYQKLDVHAPVEEITPLLATDGLKMVFPEATLEGVDKFIAWYRGGDDLPGVINIFFDEVHQVKSVELAGTEGDKTIIKVVVKWEASVWQAPDANSKRIVLDAYQTWEVVKLPSGSPGVITYIVDELKYYPGSATL